jgi:hypothetical protein
VIKDWQNYVMRSFTICTDTLQSLLLERWNKKMVSRTCSTRVKNDMGKLCIGRSKMITKNFEKSVWSYGLAQKRLQWRISFNMMINPAVRYKRISQNPTLTIDFSRKAVLYSGVS